MLTAGPGDHDVCLDVHEGTGGDGPRDAALDAGGHVAVDGDLVRERDAPQQDDERQARCHQEPRSGRASPVGRAGCPCSVRVAGHASYLLPASHGGSWA